MGRGRYIKLTSVSVDLGNQWLQKWLSGDGNWENLFKSFCLERLMGSDIYLSDYVEVEEIKLDGHGSFVTLYVSEAIEELLEKYNLRDIDVSSMEEMLEDLLKNEARGILETLEREWLEIILNEEESSGET